MPRQHPPLVVIANGQELHTRALESILGPRGYAVLRAYTGAQALERCRSTPPDIIILDLDLPDMDGLDVCRALRSDPAISKSTPILVTSSSHASRKDRLDALRAGAWDFLGSALDDEELPLRLDTYVRAKFDSDRAREEGLVDQSTGLYNVRGLSRRARELGSHAFRNHEPFACVVFSPMSDQGDKAAAEHDIAESIDRLAKALRKHGRTSDAVGRVGPTEFAVVAQATDAEGAVRMAERLTEELRSESRGGVAYMAGIDAVRDYREAPIDPTEMLARASRAMHQPHLNGESGWIRRSPESRSN